MYGLLQSPQPEVACVTIKAGGRPAVFVVAHELADPLAAMGKLDEIARAAGEALERIVLSRTAAR